MDSFVGWILAGFVTGSIVFCLFVFFFSFFAPFLSRPWIGGCFFGKRPSSVSFFFCLRICSRLLLLVFFYCDPILFLRLRLIGFPCWLLIGSFSLRWLRVIFFLFFFWVYCVERGFIGGFIVPFCLSIVAKVGVDWTIFELFLLFGSFSLSNRLLIESSDWFQSFQQPPEPRNHSKRIFTEFLPSFGCFFFCIRFSSNIAWWLGRLGFVFLPSFYRVLGVFFVVLASRPTLFDSWGELASILPSFYRVFGCFFGVGFSSNIVWWLRRTSFHFIELLPSFYRVFTQFFLR